MIIALKGKTVELQHADTAVEITFGLQMEARKLAQVLIENGFDQSVLNVAARKLFDADEEQMKEEPTLIAFETEDGATIYHEG